MLHTYLTIDDGLFVITCWIGGALLYLLAARKAQRERRLLERRKRSYDIALKRATDKAINRVHHER